MKLLIEEAQEIQCLAEAVADKKKFKISGVFMQSELKNKNGRMYPRHILEREVQRYNNEFIREHCAVGELSHPAGPGINMDRISHKITSLRQDGNNFLGEAEVLDTPMGKIVQNLIEGNVKFGVSSRGVGTLKQINGYQCVQDDYRLCVAADVVHNPSAPDAWVSALAEGKEWVYDNGLWLEKDAIQAKKILNESTKHDREIKMLRLFEAFLDGRSVSNLSNTK